MKQNGAKCAIVLYLSNDVSPRQGDSTHCVALQDVSHLLSLR